MIIVYGLALVGAVAIVGGVAFSLWFSWGDWGQREDG